MMEDANRWQVIYPLYLDKAKSVSEGRRVPASAAVENPKAEEIATVCKFLKLECVLESDKRHPADFFNVGRVRVKLFNGDSPANPEIKNKKALLAKAAELIPNLKTRGQTQEKGGAQKSAGTATKKAPGKKPQQKGKKKK